MRAFIEDENAEDGVQLRVSIYYLKKNPIKKTFIIMILYFFVYSLTVRIIVLTKKQETWTSIKPRENSTNWDRLG